MIPLYLSCILFIGTTFFLSNGGFFTHQTNASIKTPYMAPHVALTPFSHPQPKALTVSILPDQVSIPDLLENTQNYHQQFLALRGRITQPELHLDKTELYLDFVFRLVQGTHSIIVYGRHDRTLGPPAISMNQMVEVVGIFFKEQDRNGSDIFNVLEATSVTSYPSPIPEST